MPWIPRSSEEMHATIPRSSDPTPAIARPTDLQGVSRWLGRAACRVINAGEQRYAENLQRAVDDACASGGIVYLPPLDGAVEGYVVPHPPLRIRRAGIALVGSGAQSRLLLPPRASGPLVQVDAQGGDAAGVVLQGFWVDLSHLDPGNSGTVVIKGTRIVLGSTDHILGRDLRVRDTAIGIRIASGNTAPVLLRDLTVGPPLRPPDGWVLPTSATGISIAASNVLVRLDGVFVRACPDAGLEVATHAQVSPSRVEVSNSGFFKCGRGIVASEMAFLAIRYAGFEANTHEAIDVHRVRHVLLNSCRVEANNSGGEPDITGSAQVAIGRGCSLATMQGCYVAGNGVVPVGVRVQSEGSTTLSWNTIDRHTAADVHVERTAGALFPRPDRGELPLNTKFSGDAVRRPQVHDDRD